MADPASVENKTIDQAIVVNNGLTTPSVGLFQKPFSLGEADFLRLQQPSPVALASGGAILSFGLSYSLPFLVKYISEQAVPKGVEIAVAGVLIVIGLGLIALSWRLSSQRRRVIDGITKHFESNPAQQQIQMPEQKEP